MIEIKRKEGKNAELKASNMTKNEYFVIEKLYDNPLTGTGTNANGSFDWTLYSVALHEYKTMDDATEAMKVTTLNPPENVSFFKHAKTFKEQFDPLPVNTKVKVTQVKREGSTFSEFVVEEVGTGTAKAPEPDKNSGTSATAAQRVAAYKTSGLPLQTIKDLVKNEFPDTTHQIIEAIYNNL